MTEPTIGALFAGYGGLEFGVQAVLGGRLAWYSEIDKGALKILTHHHPDVPNIGDVTTADWSSVPRVDILTGGSPCQDLSHAGKRAGMTEGTRSNLWVAMREAIAQLRPGLVVWENVRGAYSAEADSDLEFCPGCMGEAWYRGTVLRALGRVLGDLSDLGYDAGWHGLRAADVGAPHGRFRVFVTAWDTHHPRLEGHGLDGERAGERATRAAGHQPPVLFKTPTSQLAVNGGSQHPDKREVEHLLPTPAVNDMGAAYTPDEWDAWTDRMKAEHGNGNGHGKSLAIEAQRLLPTPDANMGNGGRTRSPEALARGDHQANLNDLPRLGEWGDYALAIARWEAITGRPAPAPTMTSAKGNPQLAPAFVEWMMGLSAGHVTDAPGITRNEALRALGNGVVPQQAEAALRFLLGVAVAPVQRGDVPPLLGTPTARDHKGSGQGERLAESARRGQVEAQVRLLGGAS